MRMEVKLNEDAPQFQLRIEYIKLIREHGQDHHRAREIESQAKLEKWPLVNVVLPYKSAIKYSAKLCTIIPWQE